MLSRDLLIFVDALMMPGLLGVRWALLSLRVAVGGWVGGDVLGMVGEIGPYRFFSSGLLFFLMSSSQQTDPKAPISNRKVYKHKY